MKRPTATSYPSDVAFTPAVEATQTRKDSRHGYASMEVRGSWETLHNGKHFCDPSKKQRMRVSGSIRARRSLCPTLKDKVNANLLSFFEF
jgi:hypothetical protein